MGRKKQAPSQKQDLTQPALVQPPIKAPARQGWAIKAALPLAMAGLLTLTLPSVFPAHGAASITEPSFEIKEKTNLQYQAAHSMAEASGDNVLFQMDEVSIVRIASTDAGESIEKQPAEEQYRASCVSVPPILSVEEVEVRCVAGEAQKVSIRVEEYIHLTVEAKNHPHLKREYHCPVQGRIGSMEAKSYAVRFAPSLDYLASQLEGMTWEQPAKGETLVWTTKASALTVFYISYQKDGQGTITECYHVPGPRYPYGTRVDFVGNADQINAYLNNHWPRVQTRTFPLERNEGVIQKTEAFAYTHLENEENTREHAKSWAQQVQEMLAANAADL